MKNSSIIPYVAVGLGLLSLLLQWKTNLELKQLYCDLQKSVSAERRFIQTSVRELGKSVGHSVDFDKKVFSPNGVEVINPVTTNSKYNCP